MSSNNSALLQTGLEHHQAGRLPQAETIYRSILDEQPNNPDANHLLGVVALQSGNSEAALGLFEKAIELKPGNPEFHNMCGEAHRMQGRYESAIAHLEKALAIRPDFAGAQNNLGNTYQEMGRFDDAIACYKKTVEILPDFAMSHNNLGIALKNSGRAVEAVPHFQRAIEIMPEYAEAHSSLGNVVQELGRPKESIEHHERALAIRPDYAEARSNLGNALKALGRMNEAIEAYKQALATQPQFAMAHYNLGIAYDELRRPEEAISHYEQALAINPHYAEASNNLGNALNEVGRLDDAVARYEQALASKPNYAEAHRNLTRVSPTQAQIPKIEALLENPSLLHADAIHCHFALGNIYHKIESFDDAFEHYARGNTLKRETIRYKAGDFSVYVDRLIETFTTDYFESAPAGEQDTQLPVFILGMPRSGTTLVEQIVSSHPQVHGAGELPTIARFEEILARIHSDSKPYPECMPPGDASIVPRLARKFLDELRGYSPDATRVTDKMPYNFMRIGLIKTLFPKARIIHCQRIALDTCTSNYLNYFAEGNEYSFDLKELGQYYLDYQKMMSHWNRVFADDIFMIQYEEMVVNQESLSRQLIDYLGLEWDDRCLDFHKNTRAVNTFSSAQVRQPIYLSSMNRWKRYEKQLAPLVAMLGTK